MAASLGLCPAGAAVAQPPPAAPVQAIITYAVSEPTPQSPPEETWFKHGDAVRIDWSSELAPGEVTQTFLRTDDKTTLKLIRAADGRWRYAHLSREGLAPASVRDRLFTGATETHLGETCRVWRKMQREPSPQRVVSSGCMTSTGIELWWHTVHGRIVAATRIIYQPVAAEQVALPWRVLDIRNWTPAGAAPDHRNDYKVCLRSSAIKDRGHCTTKSGTWIWSSSGKEPETGVHATNAGSGIRLDYEVSPEGSPSLVIRRDFEAVVPRPGVPISGRAASTFLGHDCHWVDLRPPGDIGVYNVCKTPGGIWLATESAMFAGSAAPRMSQAVLFERTPQPLPALITDPGLLAAALRED
jgi:hypothetical protein